MRVTYFLSTIRTFTTAFAKQWAHIRPAPAIIDIGFFYRRTRYYSIKVVWRGDPPGEIESLKNLYLGRTHCQTRRSSLSSNSGQIPPEGADIRLDNRQQPPVKLSTSSMTTNLHQTPHETQMGSRTGPLVLVGNAQ
jgi:hypothetical protein